MSKLDNYECDGQIELTDYLSSQIVKREVMDLTSWINSHGKSQYRQIGEVISKAYERYKDEPTERMLDNITNLVSIYVLQQSSEYMNYLREQAKV